ncbi:uridine kinase [Persicimonas caeni]|uniref:Uridine kinase n=1 Tax=Persicimonas caeni TaxID=2292766 RepID=A0A4Y6PZ05_PERCE|nr:uridine kinase [Persicimonas caeni]QDG53548.1 uridine kinase [Persicimonas caeni]QED34769.1 uridine kinase [Persicimonas caeni]
MQVDLQDSLEPPVIVGIAGGTGSGKTTLARRIQEGVGDNSTLLQHDWYYHDQSNVPMEERAKVNFDHPESLDNDLLVTHLTKLKAGEAVEVPQYDFTRHTRLEETVRVEPTPVVVVEGILLFAVPELRERFDIKLYVDTDSDIRAFRRIRRDIRERGRDFESIRAQYYKTVRPMHLEFVEPSKRWADLIIPEGGNNFIALDVIIERLKRFLEL